ncbi:YppG family protein [Alkalihalobacterium alkalinitrilicum]|uniref:YppG family protein n=1 Tax=Alkalihalobacterium alkalinitrilicum TaxID=427920 RepID=UPI0009956CCD|nr:YppG family protein [Alkalihalobacterium alkalinitrilicum]
MNFYNETPFMMQNYPYYQQPNYYQNQYQSGYHPHEMYSYPNPNHNLPYQQNWPPNYPVNNRPNFYGTQHPYGQQGPGFLNAFKGPNGNFDIAKTFQTVDQVVKTVNQISPIVKSVSSMFTTATKV